MRKGLSFVFAAVLLLGCLSSASACTLFYVGGDMTEDGTNWFARSEDYVDTYNKLYYVSPAGKHTAGEVYRGCYGFSWTFTHDSYQYTARRDDNLSGVCPDCGGTHDHTPYEEAGTNDHGVTISATETLYAQDAVLEVDPYTEKGIEEAEIVTVILSEAASAREGVELLLSIYEDVGAQGASGLIIADQNEQWLVENCSGSQYIALKLPASVAFLQPNMSVLGRIDLDDSENLIASDDVIGIAQKAGTFVGDAEENVIDFRASYDTLGPVSGNDSRGWRLAAGLNYLSGTDQWTGENVFEDNDTVLTNIAEDGSICTLHNRLTLKKTCTVDDVLGLYREWPIGYENNVEIHFYQFCPDAEPKLGTVERSTMGDGRCNAYVPCYPMLLTDTWEGFQCSPGEIEVWDEEPESGDYDEYDGVWLVYPEGWEQSYCWTMKALAGELYSGDYDEEEEKSVQARMAGLQTALEERFEEVKAEIAAAETDEARQQIMTAADMEMSVQVHDLALKLYRELTAGED
ncbi:MAG: C69 family dipeptidase [Oscillospiraceae bacterium]|nr:C69 family dipeptidase [Oscillospiraceae bacterium]